MPSGPLQLTATQSSAIIALTTTGVDPALAPLAAALGEGVTNPGQGVLIPAIGQWASLSTAQQQALLNGLSQGFAALMAAANIQPPPVTPVVVTITYLLNLGGGTGTMTFTNGILTAHNP
jgi:hypothetical protein